MSTDNTVHQAQPAAADGQAASATTGVLDVVAFTLAFPLHARLLEDRPILRPMTADLQSVAWRRYGRGLLTTLLPHRQTGSP